MPNIRPYIAGTDYSNDTVPALQGDNPAGQEFVLISVSNRRLMTIGNSSGTQYPVADLNMSPRNAKNIVWSSEGYTNNATNTVVPALTAPQKIAASGTSALNAGTGTLLDLSPYRNLVILINYTSLTGGSSPTIQFEFDVLDDAGTPASFALFKPTAQAAGVAAAYLVSIGLGSGVMQAAAAPSTAAAGFAAVSVPSGLVIESIPVAFPPNGRFAWTVANTPTSAVWTAFIYGIY